MSPFSKIPCTLVRGGTSKGVFLQGKDLPPPGPLRDRLIKALMGTPDKRQIDGLGGGDILTSKVAIIDPRSRSDADVDYTFAQVGIEQDSISYDGTCGNISAAVGPFAIEAGLVRPTEPFSKVRIHNTNLKKVIEAEFPVQKGIPQSEGDYQIDGVPGTGAKIIVDFAETVGSRTGKLFPTEKKTDLIDIPGFGALAVSILDFANPVLFVRAKDFGMAGTESLEEIEANKSRIELFETIRGVGAEKLGFVSDYRSAYEKSPYVPFFCLVGKAASYPRFANQKIVDKEQIDLTARLIGFKKTHKTFPGTGAVCLAVASRTPGTVVHEIVKEQPSVEPLLQIGHPSGVMGVEIGVDPQGHPKRAAFATTWRKIMEGHAFIRPKIFLNHGE